MTPSEEAKEHGFKTLTEVARIFKTSTDTLVRMHKQKHDKFLIVLHGCLWHINKKGE